MRLSTFCGLRRDQEQYGLGEKLKMKRKSSPAVPLKSNIIGRKNSSSDKFNSYNTKNAERPQMER
jgi:hypothetical protein